MIIYVYQIFIIACSLFLNNTIMPINKTTQDHSITIFVHGTYPIRKILEKSPARQLMYCPEGLSLAKELPNHYHFYQLAQGCVTLNPNLYSFDQFYLFGWSSEKVYDSVRYQAALTLVTELQKLVDQYHQEHSVIPKIRLIGFSHGGNVVLHTANFLPLTIDTEHAFVEVWLFGTPVQQINQHLVNSNNFNKVYSFYSKKDWLQRMDPQGLRNGKFDRTHFWSDRMFDPAACCVQVEFTVNGKPISHSYYRSILKYFPTIQQLTLEQSEEMVSGCIAVNLKK